MKKITICFFIFLFSFNFLLSSNFVVKMSEDPWPPYTYGESGKTPTGGIATALTKEIFKRLSIKVDIKLYPWNRCLLQMKEGTRDGLMLLSKSAEREEFMDFTDELLEVRGLIYYNIFKLHKLVWRDFSDLKSYTIGLTSGFNYGKNFIDANKKYGYRIQYADNDEQNFQKLASNMKNAPHIFLATEATANAYLANHPEISDKLDTAEKPFIVYKFYMAFSKKSNAKMLIPKINKIIKDMKKEGFIRKIIDQ